MLAFRSEADSEGKMLVGSSISMRNMAECRGSGRGVSLFDLSPGCIRGVGWRFAYFSIYNKELGKAQIYRFKTLPFGATHSVHSFLRLSGMICWISVKCLKLITTNFFDDFILASPPSLRESAKNSMELVFMLTG